MDAIQTKKIVKPFRKVQTKKDRILFDSVWQSVWYEEDYELEFSDSEHKYLIIDTDTASIAGTLEFDEWHESHEINNWFNFNEFEELKGEKNVFIIDKLCLLRKYRLKNLGNIMMTLAYFAQNTNFGYFIALIEPRLAELLKRKYHLPIEIKGDAFHYKGDNVLPILFNNNFAVENYDKPEFSWITEIFKA